MQACPGFATYEVLDNMAIQVNGEIPTWEPGSILEQKLSQAWEKYGAAIAESCSAHRVPAPWLMGVMIVESQGNPRACSPSSYCGTGRCCAYGLMQFIDTTARCYGRDLGVSSGEDLIDNPDLAIELAARFFADRMYGDTSGCGGTRIYGFDLPKLAASYNAGSARCTGAGTFGLYDQHNYSYSVCKGANTALALGIPTWGTKPRLAMIMGASMIAAGVAAAAVIWSGAMPTLQHKLGL